MVIDIILIIDNFSNNVQVTNRQFKTIFLFFFVFCLTNFIVRFIKVIGVFTLTNKSSPRADNTVTRRAFTLGLGELGLIFTFEDCAAHVVRLMPKKLHSKIYVVCIFLHSGLLL